MLTNLAGEYSLLKKLFWKNNALFSKNKYKRCE